MMVHFMSVVGTVAVIAVLCQGGFGVHVRMRCVRICQDWNGFPEHLKGFPGNVRQFFSPKSDSLRNYLTKGCDCAAFKRNIFHRGKRSIYGSTEAPITNTSKGSSDVTVNITKTSKPIKPDIDPDTSDSKCTDPPDRSVNRTWRANNITAIQSKKIEVYFKENGSDWYANVTWQPPLDNRLYGYLVIWSPPGLDMYCKEVLNNKTFMILDKTSGWEYPRTLHVVVFSLPGYLDIPMEDRDFGYSTHFPKVPFHGIPLTLEPPIADNSLKYAGSLLAGVLAGIFLISVLVFVLYRRKSCGSSGYEEGHPIIATQENNNAEGFVKINNTMKPQNNDIYFASYLPENETFSNEVATIAYKLGTMGYKVTFDKVDSVRMNEIGFNMWVDKQILEAKKYIVFCSPGYVRLWQSLTSSGVDNKFNNVNDQDLVRVRYEIKRISDVYSENCSTSRIVCIKMDPKMTTKQLPPWMNHNMLLWPEQKEDIIRRLNDQAAMVMHV